MIVIIESYNMHNTIDHKTITFSKVFISFYLYLCRFESVIHEFDPYFNYRTTKYLADNGFYSFHNWFDDRAWYPLGRIIGGTIYPGLMVTASCIYHVLNALNITLDVREVREFTNNLLQF